MTIDRQLLNQPKEVVFCKKCVVSNQRPRITFNEHGVCSACQYAEEKQTKIDWSKRKQELQELCDKYRRNDGRYDVVTGCSGGKDSAKVAHTLKHEYGMHPLPVTFAPFLYTDIGMQNLQAFIGSGFPVLQAWPNSQLYRKLARTSFEAVGDNFQPFGYGQMAWPLHVALQFDIKLIFDGEQAEIEYGGASEHKDLSGMPIEDFAEIYFKGATVDDIIKWGIERGLISKYNYNDSDLMLFRNPPIEILRKQDVQFHWFSYYLPWNPTENYHYAVKNTGFKPSPYRIEGTYSNYASLDDRLDGLHYYMSYIKFGIGRATSDATHEIRDGHITRDKAIKAVKHFDGEFPVRYLGDTLEYLDITRAELFEIIDKYRPEHLWKNTNETWELKHHIWRR